MGDDLSASIGSGFEDRAMEREAFRRSLFLQGKGGRKTGNAAADDDDCAGPAHD